MTEGCIGGSLTGAAFFRNATTAVIAIIASNKASAHVAMARPALGLPAIIVAVEMPGPAYLLPEFL
jgi:hypothetical protein